MKQTILTTKQSDLLERLLVTHGQVVSSHQIYALSSGTWDQNQAKNVITKLVQSGWLIRLQRGLYAISDFSNRGFLSLPPQYVANLLVPDSYVSLESALNYYGLFDQFTDQIFSLTLRQHKSVSLPPLTYQYIKCQPQYFFGWAQVTLDQQIVRLASAEKALIDMIQFHRSQLAIDLLLEILRDHASSLNLSLISTYLAKTPLTTIKIFGLVYDLLGLNSKPLTRYLSGHHGTSWMLPGDTTFNAKWRLYYNSYFNHYAH